jgi:MFS family permease
MFKTLNRKSKILLISDNLWYFGEGMFGPMLAVFTERIGGDVLDISWAWAIYLIVTGVLIMAIGKMSDEKIAKEKLVVAGYGLNAFCTFAYLLVSSPWHLFLVQIGLGVAAALATPTWNALYSRYEKPRHAGLLWGMSDGQAQLVSGIAIIIGGIVLSLFSFTALFIIMGLVQIYATFYLIPILKKSTTEKIVDTIMRR